jgi:hypothetical protein
MRFARVFCFFVILGSSAAAAFAQTPVDPIARINLAVDPACGGVSEPECYNGVGPLQFTYSPTLDAEFVYDPANPSSLLTTLVLQYLGVPTGTNFVCQSDIWETCSQSDLGGGITQFTLTGGPGPCQQNGGVSATCPGDVASMDGVTVTNTPVISETPEPAPIFLFGTGLLLIFVGTRRRTPARA